MLYLQIILGALVFVSWVYFASTLVSARRWKFDPERMASVSYGTSSLPPVTILKPVCGSDPFQVELFRSFFMQSHQDFQLIFGALSPDDPALDIVRQLQCEFPNVDCTIRSGGPILGCNRKVSNLLQMMPDARHNCLVLCDSDMLVTPDYAERIAREFMNPKVGIVTCPYKGYASVGFASSLEAIGIGADFIPSAFVGWHLTGLRFGFGSTIAIRKEVLAEIGGFEGLINELADDYLLVNRASKAGYKAILSDYIVSDALGREDFREMWRRRLRWAKTSRAMSPGPYLGSFVTHGFALSLLFAFSVPWKWGIIAIGITIALRTLVTAFLVHRYTGDKLVQKSLHLLPASDLLSVGIFMASWIGNRISWRGEEFVLTHGGQLKPVGDKSAKMV